MIHHPITPAKPSDRTLAECRALAAAAMPTMPQNALLTVREADLAAAIYAIAGPRGGAL